MQRCSKFSALDTKDSLTVARKNAQRCVSFIRTYVCDFAAAYPMHHTRRHPPLLFAHLFLHSHVHRAEINVVENRAIFCSIASHHNARSNRLLKYNLRNAWLYLGMARWLFNAMWRNVALRGLRNFRRNSTKTVQSCAPASAAAATTMNAVNFQRTVRIADARSKVPSSSIWMRHIIKCKECCMGLAAAAARSLCT